MKRFIENLVIFLVMGSIYLIIELLWRGESNPIMGAVGGAAGLSIGALNQRYLTREMGIIKQGVLGALIVTAIEFVSGCIFNLWLGMGLWDYSTMPLNVLGQICVPFMIAWFFLALVAIVLDDYLRAGLFGEEKPHYHLFDHEVCGPGG